MSEATVSVEFAIRTKRGVYTVDEARFEMANLEAALKDVDEKQFAIDAAKDLGGNSHR
jgi:hypothetical protein